MSARNSEWNLNLKVSQKLLLFAASFFWLLPGWAWAQYNIFVNVEGIPGESISSSHPNTIEAAGFSLGTTNTFTNNCGSFLDLSITKFADKASPLLMLKCASDTNSSLIGQVTLFVQRNVVGSARDFLEIRTGQTRVSSIISGSTTNGQPTEVVTFRLQRLEMIYTPFDTAGNPQGPISSCYNAADCASCP